MSIFNNISELEAVLLAPLADHLHYVLYLRVVRVSQQRDRLIDESCSARVSWAGSNWIPKSRRSIRHTVDLCCRHAGLGRVEVSRFRESVCRNFVLCRPDEVFDPNERSFSAGCFELVSHAGGRAGCWARDARSICSLSATRCRMDADGLVPVGSVLASSWITRTEHASSGVSHGWSDQRVNSSELADTTGPVPHCGLA